MFDKIYNIVIVFFVIALSIYYTIENFYNNNEIINLVSLNIFRVSLIFLIIFGTISFYYKYMKPIIDKKRKK